MEICKNNERKYLINTKKICGQLKPKPATKKRELIAENYELYRLDKQ